MGEELTFDDIITYLKEHGFRRISARGGHVWVMINDSHKLSVTVEENLDTLTEKEEESIKQRLRELGYLE